MEGYGRQHMNEALNALELSEIYLKLCLSDDRLAALKLLDTHENNKDFCRLVNLIDEVVEIDERD